MSLNPHYRRSLPTKDVGAILQLSIGVVLYAEKPHPRQVAKNAGKARLTIKNRHLLRLFGQKACWRGGSGVM